jgi:hypothetical protein
MQAVLRVARQLPKYWVDDMTPEELARQQTRANYLRQQQDQAEILRKAAMSPEALAEAIRLSGYDPQGKEQMLATMLRGGQDALFSEGPRGKQVGDIYVAPTWSESLNSAVQKGLGGYQMGQARNEQTDIDKQRATAASAEAQVAAEQAKAKQLSDAEKEIMRTMDSQGDDDRAERQMAQRAELAGLSRAAADARAAKTASATTASSDKRTVVAYTDPTDPTKPLNVRRDGAGNLSTMDNQPIAPEIAANLVPWKPPTKEGNDIDSVSKRRLKQEESVFNQLDSAIIEAKAAQEKGLELGRPIVDYLGEKAGQLPIGGQTAENVVTNNAVFGYTPAETEIRGKIDGATQQYKRAFTGANLTLLEELINKNWDPSAKGISTTEKIRRAEELQRVLNQNREVFELPELEQTADPLTDEEEAIYQQFPNLRPK